LPRVVAQQAEIRPQGGAQEAHLVTCLVGDDVAVGVEEMHVVGGGAGRAQFLAHLVQMVAIGFVVAMHVQHRQARKRAGRPGDGVGARVDVAGQDHGIGTAERKIALRRILAP